MLDQNRQTDLNPALLSLDIYASKAISLQAKNDPDVVNLSFGEPEFGPPDYSIEDIAKSVLCIESFLDSVKRYEASRGSLELRQAVSEWYKRRYGLDVNPNTEVMITHGGVEAITLAILCTTEVGDSVLVSDPSYMLYKRTIIAIGREPNSFYRPAGIYEYKDMIINEVEIRSKLKSCKAIIINSPENPSGYVLDKSEWELLGDLSKETGIWVIHDEVYDSMAFERKHYPARTISTLSEHSILINSFSKKFGVPGLRIGWMVANKDVVDVACKVHDYLYLGVNILYEKIAERIISDERSDRWLSNISENLQRRANKAMSELGEKEGFSWTRKPSGAMFLFPNVRKLYEQLPAQYALNNTYIGDAVAQYLLNEKKIAVVPGSVYGNASNEHIRLVLCTAYDKFELAINRLKAE